MLLKIASYQCSSDCEIRRQRQAEVIAIAKAKGIVHKRRKPDKFTNARIVELPSLEYTIAQIASTLNVSESHVKLILTKAAQLPLVV